MRRRIGLLLGQADEKNQKSFLEGFNKKALEQDCDVFIFAMNKKRQPSTEREFGDSNIFSLVERGSFDDFIVLADTIQSPKVLEKIEEILKKNNIKSALFVGGAECDFPRVFQENETLDESKGKFCYECAKALIAGESMPEYKGGAIEAGAGELKADEIDADFEMKISDMEDDFLLQTEASGVISTVFSYLSMIRPFANVFVCLNEEWAKDVFNEDSSCGYTDRVFAAMRSCENYKDEVGTRKLFDRKNLLPSNAKEGVEGPQAMYFSPLFFEDHCFGYVAIDYGKYGSSPDLNFKRWLSAVCRCMEGYRRYSLLKNVISQMEIKQVRDDVTGLYNYRGYVNTTVASMEECYRNDAYLNVVVLELCGLDESAGRKVDKYDDKILADFAQLLMTHTQAALCYLGGTEFLISNIYGNQTENNLDKVVDDLRPHLDKYCHANGIDGALRIVAGTMSGHIVDQESVEDLILNVIGVKNMNLRQEKKNEETSLTSEDQRVMDIVKNILDNNLLTYHFQPIVMVGSGEIYGYEALMRANVEEKISPLDILKYAERLNRLDDVEKATFFNVLDFLEANDDKFEGKKVFINSIPGTSLSPKDTAALRERLTKVRGKVVVELTEQSELSDAELETLRIKCKNVGVETAVDDYGTGYSNVLNLLRYMPNIVKIDRMLLAGIQLSPQKQHFVNEIIEFSHNNNITVLAEGVETTEELKMVTMLGADLIQGYYTARPNAQVLQKIEQDVMNEMVQYGLYALDKDKRKVYLAGQESEISLIKLVTAHYSKIDIPAGNTLSNEFVVAGLSGFKANMEIEIEDNFVGTVELRDADLVGKYEQPAIRIGENCNVKLLLTGTNILEQGGILVPETSQLTVLGDGRLKILQIAVDGYGIGNSNDKKCGRISFEQDGRIEIRGNTVCGLGIGAGLGGEIVINRGTYLIELAGEESVGIGSITGDIDLTIKLCRFIVNMNNRTAVGIGSLYGNVKISITNTTVESKINAKETVIIGSLEGNADINFRDGVAELEGYSEKMCAVGSRVGDVTINTSCFAVKIYLEGDSGIAMGNPSRRAEIICTAGDLHLDVSNRMGFDVGAKKFELNNVNGKFLLNGDRIEH